MATHPTDAQLESLLIGPAEETIRMVNLLKFRDKALYEDGSDGGCASGMEAYLKYAAALHAGVFERYGARMVYSEPVAAGVIGEGSEADYDVVAIIEYPSREAFAAMTSDEEYLAAATHREA